jgi:hypothetical protein
VHIALFGGIAASVFLGDIGVGHLGIIATRCGHRGRGHASRFIAGIRDRRIRSHGYAGTTAGGCLGAVVVHQAHAALVVVGRVNYRGNLCAFIFQHAFSIGFAAAATGQISGFSLVDCSRVFDSENEKGITQAE